jgi:hypothetical protein
MSKGIYISNPPEPEGIYVTNPAKKRKVKRQENIKFLERVEKPPETTPSESVGFHTQDEDDRLQRSATESGISMELFDVIAEYANQHDIVFELKAVEGRADTVDDVNAMPQSRSLLPFWPRAKRIATEHGPGPTYSKTDFFIYGGPTDRPKRLRLDLNTDDLQREFHYLVETVAKWINSRGGSEVRQPAARQRQAMAATPDKHRHPMDGPRKHQLMTQELAETIPALYSQENVEDPIVRAKFFSPYSQATWLVLEMDGDGTLFGYADLGLGFGGELGYMSLPELQETNRNGLPLVERDLHWTPKPLSEAKAQEFGENPPVSGDYLRFREEFYGLLEQLTAASGHPSWRRAPKGDAVAKRLSEMEAAHPEWAGAVYQGYTEAPGGFYRPNPVDDHDYPEYPFYVVEKATGEVLGGWEFREDAKEQVDELLDGEWKKGEISVMTSKGHGRKHGAPRWRSARKNPPRKYIRRSAKAGDYRTATSPTELAAQLNANISRIEHGDGEAIRHAYEQVRYFEAAKSLHPNDAGMLFHKLDKKHDTFPLALLDRTARKENPPTKREEENAILGARDRMFGFGLQYRQALENLTLDDLSQAHDDVTGLPQEWQSHESLPALVQGTDLYDELASFAFALQEAREQAEQVVQGLIDEGWADKEDDDSAQEHILETMENEVAPLLSDALNEFLENSNNAAHNALLDGLDSTPYVAAGGSKIVEEHEIAALPGPLVYETHGEENLYFFDGEGNQIMFKWPDGAARTRVQRMLEYKNPPGNVSAEDFHALKKGQIITLHLGAGGFQGEMKRRFEVGNTSRSEKYGVTTKRLYPLDEDGKPVKKGRAPYKLLLRDQQGQRRGAGLAFGDMATTVHEYRMENPLTEDEHREAYVRAHKAGRSDALPPDQREFWKGAGEAHFHAMKGHQYPNRDIVDEDENPPGRQDYRWSRHPGEGLPPRDFFLREYTGGLQDPYSVSVEEDKFGHGYAVYAHAQGHSSHAMHTRWTTAEAAKRHGNTVFHLMGANRMTPEEVARHLYYADKEGSENPPRNYSSKMGEVDVTYENPPRLNKTDKRVIAAFLDQKPADSKRLQSDGTRLDGLWMGGNKIAFWHKGKIHFGPNASRTIQMVQRAVRKGAPANDLSENPPQSLSALRKKASQKSFGDSKPGSGGRFKECVSVMRAKGELFDKTGGKEGEDIDDPDGVCAAIGRRKYGGKKMAKWAKQGRRRARRMENPPGYTHFGHLTRHGRKNPPGRPVAAMEVKADGKTSLKAGAKVHHTMVPGRTYTVAGKGKKRHLIGSTGMPLTAAERRELVVASRAGLLVVEGA